MTVSISIKFGIWRLLRKFHFTGLDVIWAVIMNSGAI
jgi:hypothetical protein